MAALYRHIEAAVEAEGAVVIDQDGLNSELAAAFLEWLDHRVLADDVIAALGDELPDSPPEQLLLLAATVARAVRQP